MNTLKSKLKSGRPVFGTFNTLATCSVTRLLALVGLDFQILDLEHGPSIFSSISDHVNACRSAAEINRCCSLLVRDPLAERSSLLQALDQGANGVVIPHVDSNQYLSKVIEMSHYPPIGKRSFSPYTNAGLFGMAPAELFAHSQDHEQILIIIVENKAGLSQLPHILEEFSAYIDAVYFGAYDLSADMGLIGQPMHPSVSSEIMKAIAICNHYGVAAGGYVPKSLNEVNDLLHLGFRFITYQVDVAILATSYQEFVNEAARL